MSGVSALRRWVARRVAVRSLPGPRGTFLHGNLRQIDPMRLHWTLRQWAREYGPMFRFRMVTNSYVVIADPELIHRVLRDRPQRFRRIRSIELAFREMGFYGVFAAEGKDWHRQRRIVMQGFNTAQLRRFFPTLALVTERLRRRFARHAAQGAAVDVQKEFLRYTVDITTNLALGYDMNTLEKGEDVIQRHLEKVFPMLSRRVRAAFRYWRWYKRADDRALDRALAAVSAVVQDIVNRRREEVAREPSKAARPRTFLEAMLAAGAGPDGALSDIELFGNAMAILLGGEDTTANTMSWTTHYLLEHPEIAARVRAEADAVLGAGRIAASIEDLERLPYLEAVAQEAMRLKPVVPAIWLEANEDVTLNDVRLPRGTAVLLLTAAPALDERCFSNPHEFRPERWLDAAAAGCPVHDPRGSIPFGGGPRFCPGRNLALLETKAVISMIACNFDLERPAGAPPPEERLNFTMMPTGVWVRIKPRAGRGNSAARRAGEVPAAEVH